MVMPLRKGRLPQPMRYSTGCSDSASTTICHVCVYVVCATQLNALGEAAYHVVKAWTLFDISRQGVIRKYVRMRLP